MIPRNIIAAQIVRICGGSISFFASIFLCFTIWVSPKGLQNPYSRIIFGFSIADVLQSIGLVLSPFLSPADNPDIIFSKGTVASCEGIGFVLIMGSHAIPWYILYLTYYFLKRVKYKQSPQDFAKCEEKFIFAFIWMYAIATSVYPLIKGEINATKHGGVCMMTPRPFDCVTNGEECTRGDNANRSALLFSVIPVVTVFLLLIIVLGTFTCYIYNVEKAIQPTETSGTNNDSSHKRIHEGMDLTKQAAHQSILYILAFMLVYSGTILAMILRLLKVENTAVTIWFISLFYPIGGFLNMVIYTRPKVHALKKLIPELPILICFVIVILAGGETPSLADLGITEINRPHSMQQQQEEPRDSGLSVSEDNSRGSNINHWLEIFGYDLSSDEEDLDIEAELDKIMREMYGTASKTPQELESSMLEEGIEYEEFEDDGLSCISNDDVQDIRMSSISEISS